jgi:hypothetical protein
MIRNEPPESSWNNTLTPQYQTGDARGIILGTHQFETWDAFIAHTDMLRDSRSPVARFEGAVDALVTGDVSRLAGFLREDPTLVRARSTRRHHAMLLHYVGANGVEGFRQQTPPNAVDVARLLLDHGADVNAVADMYGGSTTLALVAASAHPKRAGLQLALLDLLIAYGARVDHPATGSATGRSLVHSCLANNCDAAGAHLARWGAALDLEDAAGVGRIDVVRSFVDAAEPRDPATRRAGMEAALVMASTYGHIPVVELLLDRGVGVDVVVDGFSGLNWAATQGHLDLVRLLLARGASPEIRNSYGGTALGAALWGAVHRGENPGYVPVIETLLAAGAHVEPSIVDWWRHQRAHSPEVHAHILQLLEQHVTRASSG